MASSVTQFAQPAHYWPVSLFRRLDRSLLLLFLWPLLLLALDDSWLFSHVLTGFIDPWVYFGYFHRLPQYLHTFAGTYYGARLPWILPGYIAYHVFPPLAAAYILHLSFYYLAVISLYLILKETVGSRAGLFAALLMGCHSFFLWAIGWDCNDGAGIAYSLVTLLALTYTAKSRHFWWWSAISGAGLAAMLHTQLFLVVFAPTFFLYYWKANAQYRKHSLLASLAGFAAGCICSTLLLGLINLSLGGDFLFFLPSINIARTLVTEGNPWFKSYAWLREATWLVLPFVAFLGSIPLLVRPLTNDLEDKVAVYFQILFLLNLAIMVIWQVRRQPVLQLNYYASYLMPSVFLALGSQFAGTLNRLTERSFLLLLGGTVPLLLIPLVLPVDARPYALLHHLLALTIALGICVLLLSVFRSTQLKAVAVLALALLSTVRNMGTSSRFWGPDRRERNPQRQRDAFLVLAEAQPQLESLNPKADALFWYSTNEPLRMLSTALSSTYLWGYRLFGENFPLLDQGTPSVEAYRKILIISNNPADLESARPSFARLGLYPVVRADRVVHSGSVIQKLTLVQLVPLPESLPVIKFDGNLWPENIAFRFGPHRGETLSLEGSHVRKIFDSDMDVFSDWRVNRYGIAGGLVAKSSCIRTKDACAAYSAGDSRDHLASPFLPMPTDTESVFFSVWVKPQDLGEMPQVWVQDQNWTKISTSQELCATADGWHLLGNWMQLKGSQHVRLLITETPGTTALLDKALLVTLSKRTH